MELHGMMRMHGKMSGYLHVMIVVGGVTVVIVGVGVAVIGVTVMVMVMMVVVRVVMVRPVVHRFGGGGSITLAAILKPIAYLGGRQAGGQRQLPLLLRVRVLVLEVPFAQQRSCSFLETVRLLFAIPDGPWQGELLSDTILVHGAQRAATKTLGLQIVRLQPQVLELWVPALGEPMRLNDGVHLWKVTAIVGHQRLLVEKLFVFVIYRLLVCIVCVAVVVCTNIIWLLLLLSRLVKVVGVQIRIVV